MRHVSVKGCREKSKHTFYTPITFPPKIVPFMG